MKVHAFLGAVMTAAALFVSIQGCTSATEATSGGIKCTPGNFVFCRCADRAEGTKLCREDGASFDACSTGSDGECVGGEVEDPQTNEIVEGPPEESKPPVEAGPPGSPVDTCPGKPTAVTPGPEIIFDGDTTGAKSEYKGKTGACATGDGAPDHVYHLQPTGSGSLSIKLDGEGSMNPLFYLRTGTSCEDAETQGLCAPPLGAGALVQASTNVVSGRDYYLVVDGASGSAGKYRLTLKLTTGAFCGDGKVDSNEACDDGNKTENDGCSNSCQQINGDPTTGNGCAAGGHKVDMWKGKTVTGTGSTLPFGNAFTKTGTSCTVSASDLNAAQDHLYEVTPHSSGNLKVTVTPTEATYNMMLVARKTCTDPSTQGAGMCANLNSAGVAETMTFPVVSGEKVYVAAEGALNAKGSYTIKFELP